MSLMNTDRLNLRRLNSDDYENMRKLEAHPEVMRFTPHRFPLSDERIKERLQSFLDMEEARAPLGIWAAELKENKDFVGWFMLLNRNQPFVELGFMTVPAYWGQGFTTEAVGRLISYALEELDLPGISAIVDEGNPASSKVLLKSGFKFVQQYTESDKILNKEIKINQYELKRKA